MGQIQFGKDITSTQTRYDTKRASALERFLVRCGVPRTKVPLALVGIFIICTTITLVAVRKTFNIGNSNSTPVYIEDLSPEMQKNMPNEVLKRLPSRNNINERGFTFIELLVVISIMSMLSSVILVGVSSIRMKVNNSYTTIQIGQYMRAIQMFVLENNRFPDPSPLSNNWPMGDSCLGADFCILPGLIDPSPKLDAEFRTVMPSLPNVNKRPLASVLGPSWRYQGIIYNCNLNVGFYPICKGVGVTWIMEGENQDCAVAIPKELLVGSTVLNSSGNTYCYASLRIHDNDIIVVP